MRALKSITSADNPRYKSLRRLVQSSQERRKSGLSVLDGIHLVEAYRTHVGLPEQLAVSRQGLADPAVRALLDTLGNVEPVLLGEALFKSLSTVVTPTGVIAVVKTPQPLPLPRDIDACVMLEDLQDPGNLGSILRTCAAAGIRHVLLSKGSVQAWSPRVLRSGMGAHFMLQIHERADLQAAARAFSGTVVAAVARAPRLLYDADLGGRIALLLGNEGGGLSRPLLDAADLEVAIPMPGGAESLNVAAAAAVCLFERVRQLSAGHDRSQTGLGGG